MSTAKAAAERVRSEYLEMPGMRLTRRQVQRLCGIDPALCDAILDSMVESRFLCVKPDGTYARVSDGLPQPRMAKASSSAGARTAVAS